MKLTRTATAFILVIWLFAGALSAMFGACAGMGMMCEGPCATAPCLSRSFDFAVLMLPVAPTTAHFSIDALPVGTLSVLEPPPKSPFSA
jgi:hypothetical protein